MGHLRRRSFNHDICRSRFAVQNSLSKLVVNILRRYIRGRPQRESSANQLSEMSYEVKIHDRRQN